MRPLDSQPHPNFLLPLARSWASYIIEASNKRGTVAHENKRKALLRSASESEAKRPAPTALNEEGHNNFAHAGTPYCLSMFPRDFSKPICWAGALSSYT